MCTFKTNILPVRLLGRSCRNPTLSESACRALGAGKRKGRECIDHYNSRYVVIPSKRFWRLVQGYNIHQTELYSVKYGLI